MTTWWDEDADRYRSPLPHKVFHVWLWPVERWIIWNCMAPETAHVLAIHWFLPIYGRIDRAWTRLVAWGVGLPFVILIWLLCKLPWFTFTPPDAPNAGGAP